jgi:hypothetical protein
LGYRLHEVPSSRTHRAARYERPPRPRSLTTPRARTTPSVPRPGGSGGRGPTDAPRSHVRALIPPAPFSRCREKGEMASRVSSVGSWGPLWPREVGTSPPRSHNVPNPTGCEPASGHPPTQSDHATCTRPRHLYRAREGAAVARYRTRPRSRVARGETDRVLPVGCRSEGERRQVGTSWQGGRSQAHDLVLRGGTAWHGFSGSCPPLPPGRDTDDGWLLVGHGGDGSRRWDFVAPERCQHVSLAPPSPGIGRRGLGG